MGDLDSGRMDFDTAAGALNMSRDSLNRRMNVASTAFQAINNDSVAGLPKQALRESETDSAISQIPPMLGYSELSAFVHGFRKWLGMPTAPASWVARDPGFTAWWAALFSGKARVPPHNAS